MSKLRFLKSRFSVLISIIGVSAFVVVFLLEHPKYHSSFVEYLGFNTQDSRQILAEKLHGQAPEALLQACRRLMPHNGVVTIPELKLLERENVSITCSGWVPEYETAIPSIIQNLHSEYIEISRSNVIIKFDVSGRRIALVAFAEGVDQAGTSRIIDGLWMWNGSRQDWSPPVVSRNVSFYRAASHGK